MQHPTAAEFRILRAARHLAFGNHRPIRRSCDAYQWRLWREALARATTRTRPETFDAEADREIRRDQSEEMSASLRHEE